MERETERKCGLDRIERICARSEEMTIYDEEDREWRRKYEIS